jgi:ketosteroid isomerase-like protein
MWDCWNRQDQDAALELFLPTPCLTESRVLNPDIYLGVDGLRRFGREIAEPWERFQLEIEDVFESDDQVIVFVRSIGEGRGSGVEVDYRSAWVATVLGGKIMRLQLYRERNEAFHAAGLS